MWKISKKYLKTGKTKNFGFEFYWQWCDENARHNIMLENIKLESKNKISRMWSQRFDHQKNYSSSGKIKD